MRNDDAKPPIKHELGGGYYYTCYWMTCNEELKRWYKWCPSCGQKIDWSEERDSYFEEGNRFCGLHGMDKGKDEKEGTKAI